MYRSSAKRLSALVVSVVAVFFFGSSSALFGANKTEKKTLGKNAIKTYFPTKIRISAPLRDHLKRPGPAGPTLKEGRDRPPTFTHAPANVARPTDPAVKSAIHPPNMPDPIADFEGQAMTVRLLSAGHERGGRPGQRRGRSSTSSPRSTTRTAIRSVGQLRRTTRCGPASAVLARRPTTATRSSSTTSSRERWIVSQFAIEQTPSFQCFAVSVTSDPLGAYYQSAYNFGADLQRLPEDLDHAGCLLPDGPAVRRGQRLGHRGVRPRGDARRRSGHRDLLRHQPGVHVRRVPRRRHAGDQSPAGGQRRVDHRHRQPGLRRVAVERPALHPDDAELLGSPLHGHHEPGHRRRCVRARS